MPLRLPPRSNNSRTTTTTINSSMDRSKGNRNNSTTATETTESGSGGDRQTRLRINTNISGGQRHQNSNQSGSTHHSPQFPSSPLGPLDATTSDIVVQQQQQLLFHESITSSFGLMDNSSSPTGANKPLHPYASHRSPTPTAGTTPVVPFTPSFMLPRNNSFGSHSATALGNGSFSSNPIGGSSFNNILHAQHPSSNLTNTTSGTFSATARSVIDDLEEKLSRIQSRYPTLHLLHQPQPSAVTVAGGGGGGIHRQHHHHQPSGHARNLSTTSTTMQDPVEVTINEMIGAPVTPQTFPSTPVLSPQHQQSQQHPDVTASTVRRSLTELSESSRFELLVDLILATNEITRNRSSCNTCYPVVGTAALQKHSQQQQVPSFSERISTMPGSGTSEKAPQFPSPPHQQTGNAATPTLPTNNSGIPKFPEPRADLGSASKARRGRPRYNRSVEASPDEKTTNKYLPASLSNQGSLPDYTPAESSSRPASVGSAKSTVSSSVASIANPAPVFESRQLTIATDNEGNEMVNQYSLIGEIGSGSFAHVHLAEHNETKELAAVKIIRKSLRRHLARNAGAAQQVATEIALLKKVRHRNIVRLHGVIDDPDDDKVVMIMQYASGGPLLQTTPSSPSKLPPPGRISNRRKSLELPAVNATTGKRYNGPEYVPVSVQQAANWTRQIATGLDYLHRHDILHRDIKPENILLSDENKVLISDLGVGAMFSDAMALKKTAGTPAFFSPEMCRGEVHLHGKASDIWALGVTTYAMVFGRVPFQHSSGGLPGLFDAIQNDSLVLPLTCNPDLRDFLTRILNKDPVRRLKLSEIKTHPWITKNNTSPVQSFRTTGTTSVSNSATPEKFSASPLKESSSSPSSGVPTAGFLTAPNLFGNTSNNSSLVGSPQNSFASTAAFLEVSSSDVSKTSPSGLTDGSFSTPNGLSQKSNSDLSGNTQNSGNTTGDVLPQIREEEEDEAITVTEEEVHRAVLRAPSMKMMKICKNDLKFAKTVWTVVCFQRYIQHIRQRLNPSSSVTNSSPRSLPPITTNEEHAGLILTSTSPGRQPSPQQQVTTFSRRKSKPNVRNLEPLHTTTTTSISSIMTSEISSASTPLASPTTSGAGFRRGGLGGGEGTRGSVSFAPSPRPSSEGTSGKVMTPPPGSARPSQDQNSSPPIGRRTASASSLSSLRSEELSTPK